MTRANDYKETPDSFAIYSAKVFTGITDRPWVEAVGVRDGKIAAIGTNEEVRDIMGDSRDLGLAGTMVAPGFVDAHCHFASLGLSMQMVDLRGLKSLEECRDKIREAAATLSPGQWLIGRSWNHTIWAEEREPLKTDLDDLVPDNPAVMTRCCGHCHWVNSRALEMLNIMPETPDPPGGQFDKDEHGQPTGILREAHKLIRNYIPDPTRDELKDAILTAQSLALENGITGVHTCESIREWLAFKELEEEGKLRVRVHHLFQPENLEEMERLNLTPSTGNDRLWVGHIKLFGDGSLGAGTALLSEEYSDEPGCFGLPFLEYEELENRVREAYARGFDVAIHAIGDLAVKNALDAIQKARNGHREEKRDRIEHVQLYRPEDLCRYGELGVTASVQPVFVATDWRVATRRWGEERCKRGYAWKTLLDGDIRLQFGSDSPVEPINPVCGLHAAVFRQDRELQPEGGWHPEQCLSLEEALAGFSRTAAWIARREDRLGTLEPGNLADLTVLESDLSIVPSKEWHDVGIALTVIGGEIVYRKQ